MPAEHAGHFSERLLYMPHTLHPVDHIRPPVPTPPPRRAEQGLPEDKFVFACLNRHDKYEPEVRY